MDAAAKLTKNERYRQGIEGLIRFSFEERRADLQWMLAHSAKPSLGTAWLKEKYYELLSKCREYPAPFQLIYDLETIAAQIFPRGARRFQFLGDPVADYYKTRLKQYAPRIKRIAAAEPFSIAELIDLLGTMDRQDGPRMVSLFLSQLHTSHRTLQERLNPALIQKLAHASESGGDFTAAAEAALAESEEVLQSGLDPASEAGREGSGEESFFEKQAPQLVDPLHVSEHAGEAFSEEEDFQESRLDTETALPAAEDFEVDRAETSFPEPWRAASSPDTSGAILDLNSDEVYKAFLNEQSLVVKERKEQILEQSGLASEIEEACRQHEDQESVRLLAELHPIAFEKECERLLHGLDRVESPLGRIMAHLSETYRTLSTPDMRVYVDYYTAQLEAAGLFEEFPFIRDRLINYRQSLIDPPPELLKQVHSELARLEQTIQDHRKCVEAQINFLQECLANETFHRVWPTISVILQNIITEELDALGGSTPSQTLALRIEAEKRSQPRPLHAILAETGPSGTETIARMWPGLRGDTESTPENAGTVEPAVHTEASLDDFFRRDPDGAVRLCSEILNAPHYSLVERQAAMRVLQRQSFAAARELFQFHARAGFTGSAAEERALPSFRGSTSPALFEAKMRGFAVRREQTKAVSLVHDFFRAKDPAQKARIFQEFGRSAHIPDAFQSLFRKGAGVDIVERCLAGIGSSRLSGVNRLKLLRILEQMAAHRKWLSAPVQERVQAMIQRHETALKADDALAAILESPVLPAPEVSAENARETAASPDAQESMAIVRTIRALDTEEHSEQIRELKAAIPPAFRESALASIEQDRLAAEEEDRQSAEEFHHHGFSDEFLQSLIENRMRAARWYARLADHSREELQKQAALPGKAQTLLHQIQTDNAFKIALRHLKKPVDPALFAELSAKFPDPEYQEKLKPFQSLLPGSKASRSQTPLHAQDPAPAGAEAFESKTARIDPSFDHLLDAAILSGPDLPALPAQSLDEQIKPRHTPESKRHVEHTRGEHAHSEHTEQAAANHHTEKHHSHDAAAKPKHTSSDDHGAHQSTAVDSIAASLARGFSGLFSKPAPAGHKTPEEKHTPARARDKKAGVKRAQQAASTLLKAAASYAKGEVYLTEKDLKLLEAEMQKHPDSRKLMDDHAYLFKIDHPDAAQFQPPIFVIIPELKALNHDQLKKKNTMTKLEQAISTAPSKKKAHLQSLLTFMERYKTK